MHHSSKLQSVKISVISFLSPSLYSNFLNKIETFYQRLTDKIYTLNTVVKLPAERIEARIKYPLYFHQKFYTENEFSFNKVITAKGNLKYVEENILYSNYLKIMNTGVKIENSLDICQRRYVNIIRSQALVRRYYIEVKLMCIVN